MNGDDQTPHESRSARGPSNEGRDFNRALRRLKKDFQKNILPTVKRHRFHLSKSEQRREKARKAARRLRRQQRKASRY